LTGLRKGLIVALVQILLVLLVAAKLFVDRARYPDVWIETAPYDPETPLRGRYVRLLGVVDPAGAFRDDEAYYEPGRLEVREDRLVAVPDPNGRVLFSRGFCRGESDCLTLSEPLAFFIPEDIPDPSIRDPGEELWVRVSVPPRGAPRPIELGVRRGGELSPLE
jgi:hypothetical protein